MFIAVTKEAVERASGPWSLDSEFECAFSSRWKIASTDLDRHGPPAITGLGVPRPASRHGRRARAELSPARAQRSGTVGDGTWRGPGGRWRR